MANAALLAALVLAYAPVTLAWSCVSSSLRMAACRGDAAASHIAPPHFHVSLNRRDALAAICIEAALLLPTGASASILPKGPLPYQVRAVADEDMKWPAALAAEAELAVGSKSGRIAAVGFGMYNTKPEMSAEAVRLALEAGVRAIDTATAYGNEKEVGQAWKASGIARSEVCSCLSISSIMRSTSASALTSRDM